MPKTKAEQADFMFRRMSNFFEVYKVPPQIGYGMVRDFIAAHFDWVGKNPEDHMADWIACTGIVYDRHKKVDVMTSADGPFFLCGHCKGTGLEEPRWKLAGNENTCPDCDGQGVFSNDTEGYI